MSASFPKDKSQKRGLMEGSWAGKAAGVYENRRIQPVCLLQERSRSNPIATTTKIPCR